MGNENLIVKKNKFGEGVYAPRFFRKGEKVWKMGGKVIRQERFCFDNFEVLDDVLQVGKSSYLKLDEVSNLFNHSCEPNIGLRENIVLEALRDIKKGEELTFDYSTTIGESFICGCGSKKCRGAVSDFFSLPKSLRKKYFKMKILPDFIVDKLVRLGKNHCPCGSGRKYKECCGR